MARFGDFIRGLRKTKGWSHDKLAREAGLSKQAIIDIEDRDDPGIRESSMKGLAEALGVTVEALQAGEGSVTLRMTAAEVARLVELADRSEEKPETHAAKLLRQAMGTREDPPKLAARSIPQSGSGGQTSNPGTPKTGVPASNGKPRVRRRAAGRKGSGRGRSK